jgi:putative PIN family toxin of toxin-antitoxin system
MIPSHRFVVDTNVLVSQLLFPHSLPGKAFQKALSLGVLLVSEDILHELIDVLGRSKFDPYITIEERKSFIRSLSSIVEVVPHIVSLTACRDPKDDKFLSLAVSGRAHFILTGDNDLLVLDPFRSIRILSCSEYLENV